MSVKKTCIMCGKPFERYDKAKSSHGGGIRSKALRPSRSVTCSPKCARAKFHDPKKKYGKWNK